MKLILALLVIINEVTSFAFLYLLVMVVVTYLNDSFELASVDTGMVYILAVVGIIQVCIRIVTNITKL